MMSKIQISRSEWFGRMNALGMLILLLTSLLMPLKFTKVSAEDKIYSPKSEATIYETMQFFIACGQNSGWHGFAEQLDAEMMNSGRFYDDAKWPVDISVGWLAERQQQDGSLRCVVKQNVVIVDRQVDVTAALDTIGVKGLDFALDTGIYKQEVGGGYTLHDEDESSRSNKIRDYFKKKYPGMQLDGDMANRAKYFNWKEAFLKDCASGDPREGGSVTVPIVGDDGTKKDLSYDLKQGSENTKAVGFGMGNDNGEQRYKCSDIIQGMKDTAGDGEAAMKKYVDKGGKPEGGQTSEEAGTKSNCESQAKISTAWVLCAFLDTVDAILVGDNGLLAITESLLNVNEEQYNNNQLKASWSYFRSIATFLLILVALVMIIGQAISKE